MNVEGYGVEKYSYIFKKIKFKLKLTMESSVPVMEIHTCCKEKQKDNLNSQNHLLKTSQWICLNVCLENMF